MGLHVGDEGVPIKFNCMKDDGTPINVSVATTKQIELTSPEGITVLRDALFHTNGVDGALLHYTRADDFTTPGTWYLQGYLVFPATGAAPVMKVRSNPVPIPIDPK